MTRINFEPQDTSVGLLSASQIAPGLEDKTKFLERIGRRFNTHVARRLKGGIRVHRRLPDKQRGWKQLIDDDPTLAAKSLQRKEDLPSNCRRKNDPFTTNPYNLGLDVYGLSNGTGGSSEYATLGRNWIAVSEHGLEEDHYCNQVSSDPESPTTLADIISPETFRQLEAFTQ